MDAISDDDDYVTSGCLRGGYLPAYQHQPGHHLHHGHFGTEASTSMEPPSHEAGRSGGPVPVYQHLPDPHLHHDHFEADAPRTTEPPNPEAGRALRSTPLCVNDRGVLQEVQTKPRQLKRRNNIYAAADIPLSKKRANVGRPAARAKKQRKARTHGDASNKHSLESSWMAPVENDPPGVSIQSNQEAALEPQKKSRLGKPMKKKYRNASTAKKTRRSVAMTKTTLDPSYSHVPRSTRKQRPVPCCPHDDLARSAASTRSYRRRWHRTKRAKHVQRGSAFSGWCVIL